jgi:hypothetical protein
VGLAKECATFVTVGGVGVAPTGCTAGSSASFSRTWTGSVAGLKCLTASAATTDRVATLSVTSAGVMTCAFTPS